MTVEEVPDFPELPEVPVFPDFSKGPEVAGLDSSSPDDQSDQFMTSARLKSELELLVPNSLDELSSAILQK